MRGDAARIAGWSVAAVAGIALVAIPSLPRRTVAALAPRFAAADRAGRELFAVLQWHDEACRQGDLAAFERRVTARYTRSLARRLQALGRALDAAALREHAGLPGQGLADRAGRHACGCFAVGQQVAWVAGADDGRGVEVFVFVRDETGFLLDAVEHQPAVDAGDAAAVAALADRLLGG